MLFEEDFEDSSHHQRLDGVVTICKKNLKIFEEGSRSFDKRKSFVIF